MNVDELLRGAKDAMTARTVYGEPIERDGVMVIPAAKVRGGGGGGDNHENGGAGFGLTARPVGAYVIRDGKVGWEPAVDVNRIVLGVQVVVVIVLLVLRSVLRRRA